MIQKEAVEKPGGGVVERNLESQMEACRFFGHHARNSSAMRLSLDEPVLARGVNRLALDQRWVTEGWTELKGFPWDVSLRARLAAVLPLDGREPLQKLKSRKHFMNIIVLRMESVFVEKADVADDRLGETPGCPRLRSGEGWSEISSCPQ